MKAVSNESLMLHKAVAEAQGYFLERNFSTEIIGLEHSLPFLRNLIGQFRGTKSLSCPLLSSPLLICQLLSSKLVRR